MDELGKEFERLRMHKLSDQEVMDYIEILLPVEDGSTPQQVRNMKRLQEDMKSRYFDAPRSERYRKECLQIHQCSLRLCDPCKAVETDCKV